MEKKAEFTLEKYFDADKVEAGCDEAGRGCLAGPVFAAAVILPKDFYHPLLNDSKKINKKNRLILRDVIEREAISYGVGSLSPLQIDKINILKASFKSMHKAVDKLNQKPELLLIDGNRFVPYKKIPFECIIKGDGKYASIAAASILAKTYRDEYMEKMHKKFPMYHWEDNKGYPTQAHRDAIKVHGICKLHRKSFNLEDRQLKLFDI